MTGIDVFTNHSFAVSLYNVTPLSVAEALTSIFFQHSYIPEKIVADLGTQFTSGLFHELTQLLEIKIEHASLKHPQSVGVVERAHSCLKKILKMIKLFSLVKLEEKLLFQLCL